MDSTDVMLMIAIAICILFSAYFSSTETAFSSLNKVRLKNSAKNGEKGAALAYDLSEQFDKILSTILIGNNIVNIVSASLSTVLFTNLLVGVANGESLAVTLSTIVMTILVLIFGEITPKTLAKEYPEKWAVISSPLLKFFMVILAPLNFPFTLWKMLLSKIFTFDGDKSMSDEELITLVEEAEQDGGFDEHESKLIRSAIEFDDCEAVDIITSRLDIVAIPKSYSMEEVKYAFVDHGFSRLPVYEDNIDQIIGFIHQKDFYEILFKGYQSFESVIKPIHCTVPKIKVSELFRELQAAKSHICIVVDEFGSTMGIITMEDIIEELVGEIWDENDEVILEFTKIADDKYTVLCSTDIENFFEEFEKKYDEEKYDDIQTVSGWVIAEIGHIPEVGDTFDFENLTITVSKTDYRRILEIEVLVREEELPTEDTAE